MEQQESIAGTLVLASIAEQLLSGVAESDRKFEAIDGPVTPNECGTKPGEQEANHQNAVRGRAGILHLLDSLVRHQHRGPVRTVGHLQQPGLAGDQLLPTARLHVQLLQSYHLLLYEQGIPEVVPEHVPLFQELSR